MHSIPLKWKTSRNNPSKRMFSFTCYLAVQSHKVKKYNFHIPYLRGGTQSSKTPLNLHWDEKKQMLGTSVLLQNNNNKTTTVIAKAALGHSMRLSSKQKSVLKTVIVVKIKNDTAQHFNYQPENLTIGLLYPIPQH